MPRTPPAPVDTDYWNLDKIFKGAHNFDDHRRKHPALPQADGAGTEFFDWSLITSPAKPTTSAKAPVDEQIVMPVGYGHGV
jgi:hypothetical protein